MARQASPSALSVAFIERRPVSAARTLEAIDPGDAGALLENVPSRFAARAMDHMDAGPAASVMERMECVSAAAVLREMDYPDATTILRHLPPETQQRILEQLPKKLSRDFMISLSFPGDTVGAHMSAAIMTAVPGDTAAEVLERMRRSPADAGEAVFVIDGSKKVAGIVRAAALLRHPGTVLIGEIMEEAPAPVSARARLAIVWELEAWDEFAHLPVTDRQKHVIGVLSRKAVRQALEHGEAGSGAPPPSIIAAMSGAFFTGSYGLVQLLADVEPGRTAFRTDGDRR